MNKAVEQKMIEGLKEQDNINSKKNQNQEQNSDLSLSAKAYKLFSERNTLLEVAIALNLRESEATKFYKSIGS